LNEAAEAHYRRGLELQDVGRLVEACDSYRAAVALDATFAKAHNNLGVLLQQQGELQAAVASYELALAADPALAPALRNLAAALLDRKDAVRAQSIVKDALARYPRDAGMHLIHGRALRELGLLTEAAGAFQSAIALQPDDPEPLILLGGIYSDTARYELAAECYQRAMVLAPDMAQAHFNFAITVLLTGNYEKGLDEYEWRWRLPELAGRVPSYAGPAWNGDSLAGKTILLFSEQGLGDVIQSARYIPMVEKYAKRVLVRCPESLRSLLQRSFPDVTVCGDIDPLPPFDVHCALMSLPRVFATRPHSIPNTVPYLRSDPAAASRRAGELDARNLKVGLCWGTESRSGPRKSMHLRALAPLGQVTGISFYSLQRGEFAREAAEPPPGMDLRICDNLRDFSDDAALAVNLDLIITVDTAVAHLAGALAKPVWMLTPFQPDWRWQLDVEDSPWYPTMRLFRQPRPGDWESVITKVAASLAQRANFPG
jgi:Flp pilus assembly protein TadD